MRNLRRSHEMVADSTAAGLLRQIALLLLARFRLGTDLRDGSMREYLHDVSDRFRTSLSKHHPLAGHHIFRIFDEAEVNERFVSCPETLLGHGYYTGCLSYAAAVNCRTKKKTAVSVQLFN